MVDQKRYVHLLQKLSDGNFSDETRHEVQEMFSDKTLKPEKMEKLRKAFFDGVERQKVKAKREYIEQIKMKEWQKKRKRRALWEKITGRPAYVLITASILAGFFWLNLVSFPHGLGASSVKFIWVKTMGGICEFTRCVEPAEVTVNYGFAGKSGNSRNFCFGHADDAPKSVGQFGPGLAFINAWLFTMVAAGYFFYKLLFTIFSWFIWYPNTSIRDEATSLIAACVAVYIVPTVFSFLIGVGGLY